MANSISTNSTVTSVIDGVRTTLSSNTSATTTSSNFIAGGQNVVSANATPLSVGTLADVAILTVLNDNSVFSASVISITGSAAIDVGTILLPGYQATIPWSGSMPAISAKVVGGWPRGVATPADGTVQWLVQQS